MWLSVSAGASFLAPWAPMRGATPTAAVSAAVAAASRPASSCRAVAPVMGLEEAEIGDTWFTTFDEKGDDLDVEGLLADDLVGDDLKRIFNVDGEVGSFAPDELDELMLMFKLRKELGEADYARIFDDPKVRGHDVWGAGGR